MATNTHNLLSWLLIVIIFAYSSSFTNSLPLRPKISKRFSHGHATKNARRELLNTKEYSYNQTIDHFNYRPESYDTFPQKYVIVDDYWGGSNNNSPIFVYLGAEEDIDSDVESVGLLQDTAPQFGALIVFIEHRYYGISNPKGSMQISLQDPESRGYFDSAQALADYAEIILFLKNDYEAQYSPVIVFGGSYGGMLATWFRLKYPHIAIGALASSAPIFITIVPPDTYDDWVNKVFQETSTNCYNTIVNSYAEIVQIGESSNGLLQLSQKFNTCSTLTGIDDLAQYLIDKYREAAQYDMPPSYPVSKICRIIDGVTTGATNLDKVAATVIVDGSCTVVRSLATTEPDSISEQNDLGWAWQSCSEMLNPMGTIFNSSITNSVTPVISFDLQTYIRDCKKTYGVPTRPYWVDTYYGAKDLKLALKKFGSNIIFSNGLKDPYSQEGVLEDISETLVAIKTVNGSHTLDLSYSEDTDPDWLKDMRESEVKIMKGWVSSYVDDLRAYLNGN